ncbi:MAG: protein kinase, partial [Clostridia bacterium]|nr:protein kinase [Clostridia bacterium]
MADIRCCMKCMQPIQSSKCRHCGYEQGTQIDRNYCLPEKTLLNDRYLIGCLLGSGGFGNTYIAYDNLFEMKVAIKEYLPSEIVSRTESNPELQAKGADFQRTFEDGRKKFLKEARILSSFKNEKGIVNVIDYFKANNTAYLVMEYLEGVSLAEYIESRPKGKLSEHDALEKLL